MSRASKYQEPRYPTEAHGKIPAFASYEEEAAWWDSHDTGQAAIQANFHPVTVRSTHGLSANVQVRFDTETDRELETLAHNRGIKKATLIRTWVHERLRQDRGRPAS